MESKDLLDPQDRLDLQALQAPSLWSLTLTPNHHPSKDPTPTLVAVTPPSITMIKANRCRILTTMLMGPEQEQVQGRK